MRIKLDKGAYMPTRAHEDDAGLDIYTPVRIILRPKDSAFVNSRVHVEIPKGYVGLLKSKSGLMCHDDVTTEGTIDSGYSGCIGVKMFNNGDRLLSFNPGDKITQLVIVPCLIDEVELVDEIASGERGEDGFGSTGR